MTDNIKFPPMPKAYKVISPPNSEPIGLITTRDALDFAVEAVRLNAQAVPDGWKLVPVEPTPEMIDAANLARKYREHGALTDPDVLNSRTYNSRQTYAAMLSAAPAAPQPAQQPLTVPDVGQQINRLVGAAFRKGELWERCQGKFWPESESAEFTKLRDETIPSAIAQLQLALSAPAPQPAQPLTAHQRACIYAALSSVSLPDKDPATMFAMIVEAVERAHRIGVKP